MLFNVERDGGSVIEGYCVPDGFEDEPSIRVIADGKDVLELACSHPRDAVREAGRHATGLVGFRLDEKLLPGLSSITKLSLREARSGLLIYKRPVSSADRPLKLVRLETGLLPHLHLDIFCGQYFQYACKSAERFGHETAMQIFHLHAIPSIYLSGRFLLRNYEEFLDKGFQALTLLPDPYYELASRLYLLQHMVKSNVAFLGDRDHLMLGPAADHFDGVTLIDRAALRKALRTAPRSSLNFLRSPSTRLLACTSDDQQITRREVAPAIDLLSRFAIVGTSHDLPSFKGALGELLNVPAASIPEPIQSPDFASVAVVLRSLPEAEALLEEDLIFDHYVRDAMAK